MNEPELKFEIDEHGCIGYRVTNEGVLLSKDEKERIIDHVMRLQAENAKLRALVKDMWPFAKAGWAHTCPNRECCLFEECDAHSERECPIEEHMAARMRDLGIEVPNGN